jgi:predicted RNA-binding Zn-ribbon protein involved in translation (DUF1610 family)
MNKNGKELLNNSTEIQEERKQAYLEPECQNLLRDLISDDVGQIIPEYRPNFGFVYEKAEQAFEKETSPEEILDFLNRLSRLEILEKTFFESVSACPACESTNLTIHYHCPKCKNHNLIKTNLTEHIPCGYIAERIKFIDDKCPRCGEVITMDNSRNMGQWYLCQNCNEKFVEPGLEIKCRTCGNGFSIEQSKVLEIPKFALNASRKNEIKQKIASFDKVSRLFEELGFKVEIPGIVIGQKSGITHHFTMIARKEIDGEPVTVSLDHSISDEEITSHPLIVYVYKTSEVKIDVPIFIGVNKISEEAKQIAEGHQILMIEGSPESQETIDKIRSGISLRLAKRDTIPLKTGSEKRTRRNEEYKSEIKPQFYSTVTSIHQTENNGKNRHLKGFFKAIGKNRKDNEK